MKRFYMAITNACNRACELCSCYSDPTRHTYLGLNQFKAYLDGDFEFELQLEGGEPLLHPDFLEMINYARETMRCNRITIGTNGVLLPFIYTNGNIDVERSRESLHAYFIELGASLTLKPSINYHLIQHDNDHIQKMVILQSVFSQLVETDDYSLTFNVRRRKGEHSDNDDQWLIATLDENNLTQSSNIFYYQRYGKAEDCNELERPFIISNPVEFYLISPDGKNWGTDLIARSDHMKDLE